MSDTENKPNELTAQTLLDADKGINIDEAKGAKEIFESWQ